VMDRIRPLERPSAPNPVPQPGLRGYCHLEAGNYHGSSPVWLVVVTNVTASVKIRIDSNNDRKLNAEDDLVKTNQAFRFWVNNDHDTDSGDVPDGNDSADNRITSVRDLEDFAQMRIEVDAATLELIRNQGYKLALVSTGPQVNVFLKTSRDASSTYLTDTNAAWEQLTPSACDLDNVRVLDTVTHYLIEGKSAGTGELRVEIRDPQGGVVTNDAAKIEIKDIKAMYPQFRATLWPLTAPFTSAVNEPFNPSNAGFEAVSGRLAFNPPANEDHKVFVFVNGSNESRWEATTRAETMFKRLYWQGCNGRFVSFRWETLQGPFAGAVPAHYNLNEWLAWTWGQSLKAFMESSSIPAGYTKNVGAHSLGCTLTASALQRGMQVSKVVLMQGAIPAGCFDTSGGQSDSSNINGYERMWAKEADHPTPDIAADLGYRGFAFSASGAIYNFYNESDYALATGTFLGLDTNWESNQRDHKPDSNCLLYRTLYGGMYLSGDWSYTYDATLDHGFQIKLLRGANNDRRFVTMPHESMSFVARSRSKALGARAGVGGVIAENFNIGEGSATNLGDNRPDHSGEFTRSIQVLQPFYQKLGSIVK